jgi:death-on-curing protein
VTIRTLTKEHIIVLHDELIAEIGGSPGLRDEGLLESAISAPFATFAGDDFYPTITEKAARLAFGLISNHPFVDGNKRIGILAMIVLLEINHFDVDATDEELIELGLSLATTQIAYEDVLIWVRSHIL